MDSPHCFDGADEYLRISAGSEERHQAVFRRFPRKKAENSENEKQYSFNTAGLALHSNGSQVELKNPPDPTPSLRYVLKFLPLIGYLLKNEQGPDLFTPG